METFKGTGLNKRAASDFRNAFEVEKNKAKQAEEDKKATEQELAQTKEKIKKLETERKNQVMQLEKDHKTALDQITLRAEKAESDLVAKE